VSYPTKNGLADYRGAFRSRGPIEMLHKRGLAKLFAKSKVLNKFRYILGAALKPPGLDVG
jgi:hypothetical protein